MAIRSFNEKRLTGEVLYRIRRTKNPRLKQVMASFIRHLHAFVREVRPTQEEWMKGIQFLTETGHWCNDARQEYVLLSDTLGVSMLVDAINHRFPAGATESTVFGPFFVEGAPAFGMWADLSNGARGTRCYVSGSVRDSGGAPIPGAVVDVWQSDGEAGLYDVQVPGDVRFCRGKVLTDAHGRFGFRTVQPVSYPVPTDGPVGEMLKRMGRHPMRPAHVHTMVSADGFRRLTTHLFVKGDPYLDSDAVFGVKESLVVDFVLHQPGPTPDGGRSDEPFSVASYDFVLARA